MKKYDLIVIGTGAAGSSVAYPCRKAGWTVAVIDFHPYGGTCALRGCDPKKVFVGAAEIIDRTSNMQGKGIKNTQAIDWPALMEFKKTFTDPVPKSNEKSFEKAGIDQYHGSARFTDKTTLTVGEEVLTAKYILIAVGAEPRKLNIPGEELLTTSTQFLELKNIPKTIVFVGGGYISFEFAHVAAQAGAKVTVLHRDDQPLRQFDKDLVSTLMEANKSLGIKLILNTPVSSIEKKGNKLLVHAGDQSYEADLVVHGAGRVPALHDLDLQKAGVKTDKRGVAINEYLQST